VTPVELACGRTKNQPPFFPPPLGEGCASALRVVRGEAEDGGALLWAGGHEA